MYPFEIFLDAPLTFRLQHRLVLDFFLRETCFHSIILGPQSFLSPLLLLQVFGHRHIELEARPRGDIPFSLYSQYFAAGGHCLVLCLLMILCIAAQVRNGLPQFVAFAPFLDDPVWME